MFFCVQAQAPSQGLPCPEQKSRSRFRERLSIPYSPRVVQSRLVLVAQRTETRDGEGREWCSERNCEGGERGGVCGQNYGGEDVGR